MLSRFNPNRQRGYTLVCDVDEDKLMPCGHPRSAIAGDGITHWCSMCVKEHAQFVAQVREALEEQ
jgi:hypothetical protein